MGREKWAGRKLGFIQCLAQARKLALGIEQRDYHGVLIAARICGDQRIHGARRACAPETAPRRAWPGYRRCLPTLRPPSAKCSPWSPFRYVRADTIRA